MVQVQVGIFPGKLETIAVEEGTSIREVLKLADLEVGAEYDVKADGEVVSLDDTVTSYTKFVVLSKKIKGGLR